jgi:hypothetical protein
VGEHSAGIEVHDFETTKNPRNVTRGTAGIGEPHAVDRVTRFGILDHDPVPDPSIQKLSSLKVTVGPIFFTRHIYVHDVVRASAR